ncbi:ead/Ea22-like family protein [Raoultella ornithinolytica]|uniref:ead/Ea22-like family protein n=1 Tax=Raoultella ornithinolytica TaxID=54291 RepID=UPI0031330374
MTTDITELAQSLKAAAEKATPGPWGVARDSKTLVSNQSHPIATVSDAMHRMLADGSTGKDAEFIALANPANIRALVEALEKAQQVDEELCKLLPPGVEYMDPPDGGDVTPLEGVRRMVADYRLRIAELESRTVTVSKSDIFNVPGGETYVGGEMISVDTLRLNLAEHGIKWEAE